MSELVAERGRPTKFNPSIVAKIFELAAQGKTDEQISDIVGINSRTIRNWKTKDWEFFAGLKENKQLADDIVEGSLFKKATGFEHSYITEVATKEGVQTIRQTDYVPPSDTAAIFWLKNRRPENWKDRKEDELKVLLIKQEAIAKLSPDEMIAETERLLQKLKDERDKKVIDVTPSDSTKE